MFAPQIGRQPGVAVPRRSRCHWGFPFALGVSPCPLRFGNYFGPLLSRRPLLVAAAPGDWAVIPAYAGPIAVLPISHCEDGHRIDVGPVMDLAYWVGPPF